MLMNIYMQAQGIEYLASLAMQRKLIPFLGAGFSKGSKSCRSFVPDAEQATELMKELIISNSTNCDEDANELATYDFFEMSTRFFEDVPENVRSAFFRNYFTEVKLPSLQSEFLSLDWPYIYTINVDDAIENTGLYEAILPYKELKNQFNSSFEKKPLYKLHGDALQEVLYNSDENIVFRRDQYLKSIADPENAQFINNLKGDFSKNLFFLGCSLADEQDLLYVKNTATEWDPNSGSRIIVRDYAIDTSERRRLNRYGINVVIQINDYPSFYKELIKKIKEVSMTSPDTMWTYTNPNFRETSNPEDVLEYIGCGKIFFEDENTFRFTKLHVVKTIISTITQQLSEKDTLIIMGRRFSGKTSLISKICSTMTQYKTLYFPSSSFVDVDLLQKLLESSKSTLFVFDSNSLSWETYQLIKKSSLLLHESLNKVIVAINSTDNAIATHLDTQPFELDSKLNKAELKDFNSKVNRFALVRRLKSETNLDYVERVQQTQGVKLWKNMPNIKDLQVFELGLLYMLCALDKVYYTDAIALGITWKQIGQFQTKFNGIIESIQVDKSESRTHSSLKLVHNSKSILMHIIQEYVLDHKRDFVDAVTVIVRKINKDRQRHRLAVELILFDTLNQTFGNMKGVYALTVALYKSLEEELSGDMHYWLQRAKCIYRQNSKNMRDLEEAYKYAQKAYQDGTKTLHDKAALSLALICYYLSEIENHKDGKIEWEESGIQFAYEAVNSDTYRNSKYLKNEFRNNKPFIVKLCTHYQQRIGADDGLKSLAQEIIDCFNSINQGLEPTFINV